MSYPMSNKSPEIRNLIESVFPGTKQAIDNKACPRCHVEIGEFKNDKSRREYLISGWCQFCQDKFFGE